MAKYQNTAKEAPRTKKPEFPFEIKVTRVLDGKYGTMFDMIVNSVMIYGCKMCETKTGEPFVGFPQKRDGKDPKKFWHICYCSFSEEQVHNIWAQIAAIREGGAEE